MDRHAALDQPQYVTRDTFAGAKHEAQARSSNRKLEPRIVLIPSEAVFIASHPKALP